MHKTVLLKEVIEGLLAPQKAGNEKLVVIDATFGGGGHSLEICKKFPKIKIIALDQDKSTWEKAKSKFKNLDCDISFVNENFRNMDKVLEGKADGIIFDLGLSSDQLENSGRGFSFMKPEPLLMTMKDRRDNLPSPEDLTAEEIVNTWEEKHLADIIYGYGEERFARKIAKAIVEGRRGRIHPATKTFQALRIAVNDELGALKEGLIKGFDGLEVRGRMAVISFHSLEDRIVKRFYKEKEKEGKAKLINKKPIVPTKEEIKNNPRSRSAKLRILEKIK